MEEKINKPKHVFKSLHAYAGMFTDFIGGQKTTA